MELNAIGGIVLRHIRLWMRDPNLILITLFWPLMDILVWGFLGKWMGQGHTSAQDYAMIMLLGVLLWQVTCRTAIFIACGLLEEINQPNIVNMFALPLRVTEWAAGITIFALILSTINAFYCMALIVTLYTISFFKVITTVMIFAPPLFISGIWLGFICLQIITYSGKRAQELAFIIAWVAAPFSAAFYPRAVLPLWGQTISSWLPMSHVFEGLRDYLMNQADPTPYLIKAYSLAIPYALISLCCFMILFKKSKDKGLARLCD